MADPMNVWAFDREQAYQTTSGKGPERSRRPDLRMVLLSKEGTDVMHAEIVEGRLSDVTAMFWIDGLGWFEATHIKKLPPFPDSRGDRVQVRLKARPSRD